MFDNIFIFEILFYIILRMENVLLFIVFDKFRKIVLFFIFIKIYLSM